MHGPNAPETLMPLKPLSGTTVVVTRPRPQAAALVERLRELGAATVEIAAIVIGPPADGGSGLRAAAAATAAGRYGTVVFTSANGVERFFAELPADGVREGTRVAAIGPGTAAMIAGFGATADLVPQEYVAESLLAALGSPPGDDERDRRILLARAAVARDALPDGLRAAGWEVDIVEAYRTQHGSATPDALDRAAGADAVCFTSPSTVESYLALAGERPVPPLVACIGPITAATARRHGLAVTVEADPHTVDGLVVALVKHRNAG